MSQLDSPSHTETPPGSTGKRSRWLVPQVGLSTLLLTTACIAAWGSVWLNRRRIAQLEASVASMSSLARELIVKDREHLAIVQQLPLTYDQQLWHVYVPNDSLGLRLVTHNIPPQQQPIGKYGHPIASAHLPAGRHVIELKSELEQDQWLTQVLVDDQPVISVREPKEWNPDRGSSGGGLFSQQANLPPDAPAVLFSRLFMVPEGDFGGKQPTEPSNGLALWIDKLP